MKRMLLCVAAAAALHAATWDAKVESAARLVRERAAREPAAVGFASLLRGAELLRVPKPALAWECALAAAELLKTTKDTGYSNSRLTRILMAVDPAQGERVARELPGQESVYGALVGYWMDKRDYPRATRLLREAWRKGLYVDPARRWIETLASKDSEAAVALYRDLLATLPIENAPASAVRSVASVSGELISIAPQDVKTGLARLLAAVTAEKFDSESRTVMIAYYKLGDKRVRADDGRETLLIPLALAMRALDQDAYQRNRLTFKKWREQIETLKAEDALAAASPVMTLTMRKADLKTKGIPAEPVRKPVEEKKPLAQELAAATTLPEQARVRPLERLLEREDATGAEAQAVARALLALTPGLHTEQRLATATGLFETVATKDWKPLHRPAADAVLAALAAAPGSTSAPRAWDVLASGSRDARLKIRSKEPSLATRIALLDLSDLLDQKFDFELSTLEGKERYRLSAVRGKVVMLNFWASW